MNKVLNSTSILWFAADKQIVFPKNGRDNLFLLKALGPEKWKEFWKPMDDYMNSIGDEPSRKC